MKNFLLCSLCPSPTRPLLGFTFQSKLHLCERSASAFWLELRSTCLSSVSPYDAHLNGFLYPLLFFVTPQLEIHICNFFRKEKLSQMKLLDVRLHNIHTLYLFVCSGANLFTSNSFICLWKGISQYFWGWLCAQFGCLPELTLTLLV